MRKCLDALPGDPRYYTTSVAIRDFEAVRKALDVERWNLFGQSYGTRVALHYMRRHPDAVRSTVLDSVVPPDHNLGTDIALQSQKILDYIYTRCREDDECRKRFPNLRNEVDTLLTRLGNSPAEVRAEDFRTGRMKDYTLTQAHLTGLIRLYLYNTRLSALLPPVLHRAATEALYAPVVRASESVIEKTANMLSPGMHNAAVCTEDVPFYNLHEDVVDKTRNTYMGAALLDGLKARCSIWPQGVMDEHFKAPLKSDTPTLLLSGEYDPITPPEYAERVAGHLGNARHLVLRGQGHAVGVEGCAPSIIADFVARTAPGELDTTCLNRLRKAPLFINFNGPTP